MPGFALANQRIMQDIKFDLAVWLIWICHKISFFLSLAVYLSQSLSFSFTNVWQLTWTTATIHNKTRTFFLIVWPCFSISMSLTCCFHTFTVISSLHLHIDWISWGIQKNKLCSPITVTKYSSDFARIHHVILQHFFAVVLSLQVLHNKWHHKGIVTDYITQVKGIVCSSNIFQ